MQFINDSYSGQGYQKAGFFPPATGSTGIPAFFPNPHYWPGLMGMTISDQQYWLSRVRGGPEESTIGFYLTGKTGRLRAAEDLAQWMNDPGPNRLAVVTGSPGTGKSALLALPVLLTEQYRRRELLSIATPGSLIQRMAELLPADAPVIAIHARGLNTDQASVAIAQALGRDVGTASALLEDLDTAPEQGNRIIIVDAVDEAISPVTLLESLLVPLAHQPGLQVVVAARRHALIGVHDSNTIVDLDAAAYQDPYALIDYVYRLLIAAEEPNVTTCYQAGLDHSHDNNGLAVPVAEAIAQRATVQETGVESFLIGRLLALSMRERPEPVDVSSQYWQSDLPTTVAEAFDEDLARLRDKQPLARALLEALAWAETGSPGKLSGSR